MTPPSRVRIYLLLLLVMLLWSGNSLVGRAIRADIGPFTLAFLRWTLAMLLLLPFAWRGLCAEWPLIRRHWPVILLLGTLGVGCFNALLYAGLRTTTATNALLIQAAMPAMVLSLDALFFRTRARAAQVVGVLVAAFGALLIIFRADLRALVSLQFGGGDLLVLLGVVAWSLYTALLRLRPPISAPSFVTLTFATGVIAMAPLAGMEAIQRSVHWTPAVLGGIAYVAIFPSITAYFLYNRAVAQIGAPQAGQVISVQPLFGALLAALLLGEPLHAYHLGGMAIILSGIVIAAWRRAA